LFGILQNKSVKTHNIELYQTYFTLSIHLLHNNYQLLVFIHKYVHQRTKLPAVFSIYLNENKLVHHYNTRQKDDFHTNVVQSEMGKKAVKYKGSKLWNNLPTDLKEIQSLRSFKYKLRNHLLQSLL